MTKNKKEKSNNDLGFVSYDPNPNCCGEDSNLEGWQYDFASRTWIPVYYKSGKMIRSVRKKRNKNE